MNSTPVRSVAVVVASALLLVVGLAGPSGAAVSARRATKNAKFCEVLSGGGDLQTDLNPDSADFAIQHIGKLLVLWRPQPAKEDREDRAPGEDRMPGPRDFKVLKYSKRGGQRPEVKTLRVLGNQRLTPGGRVKRAKPKQKSIKKGRQT